MKWVECPRDSWQGLGGFIPTDQKVSYLCALLEAGFKSLDLTSFVSPRWVPQHADATEVLAALPAPQDREYLAIIGNHKGLERALQAPHLTAVGYPYSISETFQHKNLNMGIEESWPLLQQLIEQAQGRQFVVYLSMAFGNPYGDAWEPGLTAQFVQRMWQLPGLSGIVLADTYGVASAETIAETLKVVAVDERIGVHLHSRQESALEKVQVGLEAGVRWLEGALGGIGGCPFAGDELVGNLATEQVLTYLRQQGFDPGVNLEALPTLAHQALLIRHRYA